jgi:hypothetical protein
MLASFRQEIGCSYFRVLYTIQTGAAGHKMISKHYPDIYIGKGEAELPEA